MEKPLFARREAKFPARLPEGYKYYAMLPKGGEPVTQKQSDSFAKILGQTLKEEGKSFAHFPIGYLIYRTISSIPIVPIPDRTAEKLAAKLAPGGFKLLTIDPQRAVLMKKLATTEAMKLKEQPSVGEIEAHLTAGRTPIEVVRKEFIKRPLVLRTWKPGSVQAQKTMAFQRRIAQLKNRKA